MKAWVLAVCVAALAGCGGGDAASAAHEQAAAKEQLARALALDTPCDDDSQCAAVELHGSVALFGSKTYVAYSLLSATAKQAEIAAAEQRQLAAAALPASASTPSPSLPPAASCVAAKCVLSY